MFTYLFETDFNGRKSCITFDKACDFFKANLAYSDFSTGNQVANRRLKNRPCHLCDG